MNQKSLIVGRMMICPRCKRQHDLLQYIRLETIEEFAAETTPVYKCCSCKWIFSPAGEMPQDLFAKLQELLEQALNRECECEKS